MATKWKNSKTRKLIKFTAFILAVLVAGYAGIVAMDTLENTKGDDIAYGNYLSDAVMVGTKINVYNSEAMTRELQNYISDLGTLIGTYGDGSEDSYKLIKNGYNKKYLNFKNILAKNLAYVTNTQGIEGELLSQMSINVVKLEKIAEPDFDVVSVTEYDYEEIYSYDCASLWTANYPSNTGVFSSEIKKKAEKAGADAIIRIEALFFGNDYYSGYYALKINDDVFQYYLCEQYSYLTAVPKTYDKFIEEYNFALADFNNTYKGIKYIVTTPSGKIATNVKKLADNWQDTIHETMKKYDYYLENKGDSFYQTPEGWYRNFEDINFYGVYSTDYNEFTTMPVGYGYETTTVVTTAPLYTDEDGNFVETTRKVNSEPVVTTERYNSENIAESEKTDVYIFFNEDAVFDTMSVADIEMAYLRTRNFLETFVLYEGVLLAVFLLLCVVLTTLTNDGKDKPTLRDKIFIELKLIVSAALLVGPGVLMIELWEAAFGRLNHIQGYMFALSGVLVAAIAVIVIDLLMFIARRIKGKTFANGIVIVWAFRKIRASLKDMFYAKSVSESVKIKTISLIAINFFVGIFAMCLVATGSGTEGFGVVIFAVLFFFDLFVLIRGLKFVGGTERVFGVIEEYKKGNIDERVNLNGLPQYLITPAENLHGVGEGLKIAVDEAVRQEQTKTELITNISHDLKTPLTSIINYVELLKNCNITDETAISYLDILSEKSDKLKTLIIDLVEASKAATGNVTVEFVEVSLNELLGQIIGEFSETFENKKLEIVSSFDENDVIVKADSKLLYRVLENLFVNISKYSLENTRVYVEVKKEGEKGVIILKNISAAPLNISPEELKGRFVRGDQSRSTEGNGLGLSIAENLCLCQGASLELEIVGDLFSAKVVLQGV